MSTIHFVGGEKGGVGKSVVARLLSQLFIDRERAFAALDCDASGGALLRFYAEYCRPVDITAFDSADQIMDRALGAEREVVVDLPAQSLRPLEAWIEAADVLAYAREMDVGLTFWHVTDGGADSVAQLGRTLTLLDESVRIVVVRNYGRSSDFSQLAQADVFAKLQARHTPIVDLSELDPRVMRKIDKSGASLWAAIHDAEGRWALTAMERRRASVWLKRAYAALESTGYVGAEPAPRVSEVNPRQPVSEIVVSAPDSSPAPAPAKAPAEPEALSEPQARTARLSPYLDFA